MVAWRSLEEMMVKAGAQASGVAQRISVINGIITIVRAHHLRGGVYGRICCSKWTLSGRE